MENQITVAQYLQQRLEELGLEHVFGVAGNYTAPFLDTIIENPNSKISIIGNTNEINAGHCADAYARLKGISAVAVTYGVGAFSVLNPVAGSYVERNPVLVINGAPTNAEQKKNMGEGLLSSHMTGDMYSNINVFRNVTVAAEQVTSGGEAPYKIDAVLNALVSYGRPAYLEFFEDVWRSKCNAPDRPITTHYGDACKNTAKEAAKATADLIEANDKPIFWAGVELQRQNLQDKFLSLVEKTGIEFTTSIMGKSTFSEDHPKFKGVFNGNASPNDTFERFNTAGAKIGIGAWTTGKNLGGFNIWDNNTVLANSSGVRVGAKFYANMSLALFIDALEVELVQRKEQSKFKPLSMDACLTTGKNIEQTKDELTYDSFFNHINTFLTDEDTAIVDAGFPLLGAQGLHRSKQNTFVAQASWLSIGYSVPAAIGVKCAQPNQRAMVFVGDGAFQETCQAVSTQHHLKQNTVVFVLDNKIYGIEQLLVNPNPFRKGDAKITYSQKDLNKVYPYNELNNWKYAKLTDAFGGTGVEVYDLNELKQALELVRANENENFIIHVHLPKTDIPEAIGYKTQGAGEDEILNPDYSLC